MEPMTVDQILQWHAEQMRIAHEQEARERIPPLGHDRGAKTKALWNGKAYEIVPIVEPEPEPEKHSLDTVNALHRAMKL